VRGTCDLQQRLVVVLFSASTNQRRPDLSRQPLHSAICCSIWRR